jgi:hypothetical protein
MPDYFGAAGSLIGGFSGFMSGKAEAQGAKAAAGMYRKAADLTHLETAIKLMQQDRKFDQAQGSALAAAGASNLKSSGSVLDILSSNAQQGAMSRALISAQGAIQESSYIGQAGQAEAQAAAARSKSKGSLLGGIVGAAVSIFSDERLKEDMRPVGKHRGLTLYRFRYKGGTATFEGVKAQEVQKLFPEAVKTIGGFLAVDYRKIGLELKLVTDA